MKYLSVILAIFGLEWKLKNYIEETIAEGGIQKSRGGFLLIRKHHNRGAFLNAGQDRSGAVATLSAILTGALTAVFLLTPGRAGKGRLKWGLTLLLGGALSNTYDRLRRKYVVDYVSFHVSVPACMRRERTGHGEQGGTPDGGASGRHSPGLRAPGGHIPSRFEDVVFNLSDFCIMAGALLCVLGYTDPDAIES